jgi:hypothetical protein
MRIGILGSAIGSNLEFAAAMLIFYDEYQLVTSLL